MHAVHLYWRARHCWSFYIYAWAFALQSDDRALVIRLDILRRGSISPRGTTETEKPLRSRWGFCVSGSVMSFKTTFI